MSVTTARPATVVTLRYTFADPQPWTHQRRALGRIHRLNGRALVDMPMRTGKSRVAIDWAGICARNYGLRRVLVVAPLSVMGVWQQQIEEFCPVPSLVRVLTGSTKERIEAISEADRLPWTSFEPNIQWLIVNYEGVWRSHEKRKMVDALAEWQPDLVIADEAHRLKTATSRQSKAVAQIGKAARWRLALTGTPITKSPLDAFGELRFLDERIFENEQGKPASWTWFRNEFGVWGGQSGQELKGYRRLPYLLRTIESHAYAIKLEDCFDLPPKTFVDVKVAMPATTRKIYRDMAKQMIAELSDGGVVTAKIVLDKLLKLSQITSGFITTQGGFTDDSGTRPVSVIHDLDDAKVATCLDMIDDFVAQGEKVVVFCRFKHDYHRLSAALAKAGIHYSHLTGETPSFARDYEIRQFHDDPDIRVFVAQTQTGSLGIDLTPARMAIFLSMDYNWATYAQAQDRIYGSKQPKPVTIHHLVVPRTVDTVVLNALRHKGDLAHAVMHDPQRLLEGWADDDFIPA